MSIFTYFSGADTHIRRRRLSVRLSAVFAVLVICIALLPLGVSAKEIDLSSKRRNKSDPVGVNTAGYSAVLYDNTNGLPTSEANAIVQSHDGFIWIGGYSGLIRYNGNEFYRFPSSTGISSVVCLYVDSHGRLWIGTNDSGVALMENDTFRFYNKKDGLRSYSIRSISEDKEGNILLATTIGVSYIDNDLVLHNIDEQQIKNEYIRSLVCDNKGVAYGLTLSGSFFTLENKRVSAYYSSKEMGSETINCIYPDPENDGMIYLGDMDRNIIHCSISELRTENPSIDVLTIEPHNHINAIKLIQNKLWVCTDVGIGFLDDNTYHYLDDAPMNASISGITEDHEGNLWFNSTRQGVMKIVKNNFTDIFTLAGLDHMVVNSTWIDADLLYIGTDTGLRILDKEYHVLENDITKLLDGVRIRCIKGDNAGNIWLCTYSDHGLVRYTPSTKKIVEFTSENGLLSNRVRMVTQLSDGRIAVATNAGVNIIRDSTVTDSYDNSSGISNLEILTIEEDDQGRLMLGSDGDGIYIIDNGTTTRKGIDDGLGSEVILRIKKDPKENLFWIITSNSIGYMQNGNITTIKNFPYSNNFDLYFDNSDNVWVLSSNGIYVVKKQMFKEDKEFEYLFYDNRCGLPCAASPNSHSYIDEEGHLYISGSSGVSVVNINGDMTSGSNVILDVSYIMADDVYYDCAPNSYIRISSECKRLNIFPNAFTYALNSPRISYYLEGFDDQPAEVSKEGLGTVTYTNLSGGTYRFHLSSLNPVTGEAEKTIIVTIIKQRAFYEMTWFWVLAGALVVVLLITILVIYYNTKTKRLLKKQEENKKLINEMTTAFAKCVDSKDAYTNGHSFRVATYTAMIAKRMGKSKEEVESIYRIALLHDIGKISIPDIILNKPGRLNDEEYVIMKSHAIRGYDILKDITIAPELALGAACHHERIDGSGYPAGLKGDEIPEVAQIIAVADTFDAMYSTRPYRKKMDLGDAMKEIKKGSGTHFNPKVVDIFITLAKEGTFDKEPETPSTVDPMTIQMQDEDEIQQ